MKASNFRHPIHAALLVGTTFLVTGCSFFSTKQDAAEADSRSFHAMAAPDGAALPLPIEIADDITKISGGGSVSQSNGWQLSAAESASAAETAAANKAKGKYVSESSFQDDAPSEGGKHSSRNPAQSHAGGGDESYSSSHHDKVAGTRSGTYTVKSGDTLMKIAFETSGSLFRWREIYNNNKGKIGDFNHLAKGTVLSIDGLEYVVVEKNGKPYLIRRYDTLAKISREVYGKPDYWRGIWHNNPQLIHNPNKIYAGLTLYCREHPEEMPTMHQAATHTKVSPSDRKKLQAVKAKATSLPEKQTASVKAAPVEALPVKEEPRAPAANVPAAPVEPANAPAVAPEPAHEPAPVHPAGEGESANGWHSMPIAEPSDKPIFLPENAPAPAADSQKN